MNTTRIKSLFNERLKKWGRSIHFYLPGMFSLDNKKGLWPAVSITGSDCKLGCVHCQGRLLKDMLNVRNGDELKALGERLYYQGIKGILLSGGCNEKGELPFDKVIKGIDYLKKNTGLSISIHAGMRIGEETAKRLKAAGVDQALFDVIGDGETLKEIYGLERVEIIEDSLQVLINAGLDLVPHIVIGIGKGKIKGEYRAVDLIKKYNPRLISLVVFMPGVAMKGVSPPSVEEVIEVLCYTRETLPLTEVSLGCARPRGEYRYRLEPLAIECGVTRLALWSDEAIAKAEDLGLKVVFHYTCCSHDG